MECNYLKAQDSVYCQEELLNRKFISLRGVNDSLVYKKFNNIIGYDTLKFEFDLSTEERYYVECVDYYSTSDIRIEVCLPPNSIKNNPPARVSNHFFISPPKRGVYTIIVYLLEPKKYCIEFTVSIVRK
ncbi:hypothetical protein V9L05_01595 [Bernardetia sp. Wsw4-3y2]|uniref:hypothetical protein n=1 Tax=Bernardetia sp. Wsw4-3y2 TaxID=3127471 RepID=UPI0030D3C8AD